MKILKLTSITAFSALLTLAGAGCSKKTISSSSDTALGAKPVSLTTVKTDVAMWLTRPDQSALFEKQNVGLIFSSVASATPTIEIDTTQSYQRIASAIYKKLSGATV